LREKNVSLLTFFFVAKAADSIALRPRGRGDQEANEGGQRRGIWPMRQKFCCFYAGWPKPLPSPAVPGVISPPAFPHPFPHPHPIPRLSVLSVSASADSRVECPPFPSAGRGSTSPAAIALGSDPKRWSSGRAAPAVAFGW
jgi:hypothetical protein